MSKRIDNVAEARNFLGAAVIDTYGDDDRKVAIAQVHATLALVEQQRIANLIALANFRYPTLAEANSVSNRAWSSLFTSRPDPATPGKIDWLPAPDIAAALGLTEGGAE